MRTLVDLPDRQIEALAALCERVKQPRAALIRAAVDEYLARHTVTSVEAAYCLWGVEGLDGLTYEDQARAEW